MVDAASTAKQFLKLIELRDVYKWAELIAPDGEMMTPFSPPGLPKGSVGRAACQETMTRVLAAMPKFAWHDVQIFPGADSNIAFGFARSQATLINGQPYNNTYCMFFRLEEGLVVEYREYFDPQVVIAAFGELLKEPSEDR